MDVFFVVLGLLLLAFPIMAIAALVKTIGIRGQLRQVEVRLAALERAAAAHRPGRSEQRAPAALPAPTVPPTAKPIAAPPAVPLRPPRGSGCAERSRAGDRRHPRPSHRRHHPRTGATGGARA